MRVNFESNTRTYLPVFWTARKNAAKCGIPFELTTEEFLELVQLSGGHCRLSGIPFDFKSRGIGRRRPFAPSLDRIASTKGYTFKNCRLISIIANCARNEWGDKSLLKFCRAVVSKSGVGATVLQHELI